LGENSDDKFTSIMFYTTNYSAGDIIIDIEAGIEGKLAWLLNACSGTISFEEG
jgi:hypothetical protein